jgi:hypothetical protein
MSKPIETSPHKAGRPRGRRPRPRIEIPGDVLAPKSEAAEEIGVSQRTLTRMRPQSTLIGGVSYVALGALRAQIAAGLSTSKKRRAR